ncbi:TRAP transporter small permease [Pelagibius litoralis]|uniref:TRAP transporter small permease protein n=2 Tax=Pelagibius litoralis TaxID=374515 RepID=A0A967EZ28_9PROT|nr:TRAP transporter small permease [Pelagibius litoralis]
MVTLIAIFAWLVFGRYVLNETPTWVEQLALVLVCYIAFLGAAAGVRDNTHLGVSFIREAMPTPIRRSLRIVAEVAMAGFGLVMLLSCVELVIFGWATLLPMLNVPEGVRTLPAAICGGLIFLFAGGRAIGMIHKYWIGQTPDAPPPDGPALTEQRMD